MPQVPGKILDRSGEILGEHPGALGFTVGQRKGLQLGRPAPDGKPRYVLSIRPKTNEVVVGPQEALATSHISGAKFTWCGSAPDSTDDWREVEVQVRAHGEPVAAEFRVAKDEMQIRLLQPLYGVAPGQTAVIYLGTRVLGQTTIDKTVSADQELVSDAIATASDRPQG